MKKRYFLAVAAIAFVAGIIQIAANQGNVRNQVNNIAKKDEAGQAVTADIEKLRKFTSGHMQTSTSVVLKGSYERDLAAAKAAMASNTNGNVYAQAQAACAKRSDSVTQAKCVSAYVAANSTPGANPQVVNMPIQSLYTKNFISPSWTPDGAGISLLIGICAVAMAAYTWALKW